MSLVNGNCSGLASGIDYTDVVVVGNGPSAICLSFLLSGYRPYYNGNSHSNVYLQQKLQELSKTESIIQQDLEFLSEGLEGRSSNPVALLFDAMLHPDADLGTESPSLLEWKREEEHSFRHVILGKGKTGGAWQKMDGSMQTLSRGNWMEMPSLPLKDWHDKQLREGNITESCTNRASIVEVRNYYNDFVQERNLKSNFHDNHTVTSIQKVFEYRSGTDDESGEVLPCCKNARQNHPFLWEVRGYYSNDNLCSENNDLTTREEFCIQAPHVVIATGTYDIPNELGIVGENLPQVIHSLQDLEKNTIFTNKISIDDPVLVVGAGLSAADAILMLLSENIPVMHVFRRSANDSSLIFKKLPRGLYPEYHRIHSLMKGKISDSLYRPCPEHSLVEIKEDGRVLLENMSGKEILSVDVTCVVILIGARPDLSFLPQEGRDLGIVSQVAIDSKHNPIEVDLYSYQCIHQNGLFSMGPLVGDNFVRFGIGGALGITNYLLKKKK